MPRLLPEAGRTLSLVAALGAAALAGCTDELDPVRPVVAATQSTADICLVTNSLGRTAYTTDSVACRKPDATTSIFPTAEFKPGLFGLQTWWNSPNVAQVPYIAAKDVGGTMVRLPAGWADLEYQQGVWNQDWIDRLHAEIDAYASRNVQVYLNVEGTPEWAQYCVIVDSGGIQWGYTYDRTRSCPYHAKNPPHPDFWNNWIVAANKLVTEFGWAQNGHAAVTHFSFGNEPSTMFWPGLAPQAQQQRLDMYVRMARELAIAVHMIPGGRFVGPEANDGRDVRRKIGDTSWFDNPLNNYGNWVEEYLRQASSFTDVLSFHAYRPRSTGQWLMGQNVGAGIIDEIYEMTTIGSRWNKPVWITEWSIGPNSGGDEWGVQRNVVWDVLRHQVMWPNPWLERMFFFSSFVPWRQTGWEDWWGLIKVAPSITASARPSYFCFGTIAKFHEIPGNAANCRTWKPEFYPINYNLPPQPPVVYSWITGPSELPHNEGGEFTAHVSVGTPTKCTWWEDGQFMTDGPCTVYAGWSGPSYHSLTAVVVVDNTEIPTADFNVAVTMPMECGPEGCMSRRKKLPPMTGVKKPGFIEAMLKQPR